ncbi:MAG: hypothetical protein K1X74_19325 [Pirellulales bacterium]|nr:hypothetical protein [Pirellulales bacterium]
MNALADPFSLLTPLVLFFSAKVEDLGKFSPVDPDRMPAVYRTLLAHEHHMTVTVERHHRGPVGVRVLQRKATPSHYARQILLERKSDGAVVQFGIMRIALDLIAPEIRDEILQEQTPLGHILIKHNVMRQIHLLSLWRVEPGPELQKMFGLQGPRTTFGRTAMIDVDGRPAIELLEIVVPEPEVAAPGNQP